MLGYWSFERNCSKYNNHYIAFLGWHGDNNDYRDIEICQFIYSR